MTEKLFLQKRYWLIACGIVFVAVIIVIYVFWHQPLTTVLVVRHAEKESIAGSSNPPLSPDGLQRAQTLVHVVGQSGIAGIYATQYQRTQQTVQPTASNLGLPVDQIDAADVEGLVNSIMLDHAGGVVLVAGHSNTVPQIIASLGGNTVPSIGENEFDNLFVVFVYRHWWIRKAKVIHMNYGIPD